MVQAAAALPQVRAGTVKVFAQMAPKRSPTIPDIPTVDEGGVAGWHMPGWFGLFAPKGTPKEAIGNLNAALVAALADPATQKRFLDQGLDVASKEQQTPEGLAAFNKAEIEKWWPIMKAAGTSRSRALALGKTGGVNGSGVRQHSSPAWRSFESFAGQWHVRRPTMGTASKYRGVPGLLRKVYVFSNDGATVGGVYLWNSRVEADAMYTDAWRVFVREKYGTEPTVTYFESPVVVDNVTGQIHSDEEITCAL